MRPMNILALLLPVAGGVIWAPKIKALFEEKPEPVEEVDEAELYDLQEAGGRPATGGSDATTSAGADQGSSVATSGADDVAADGSGATNAASESTPDDPPPPPPEDVASNPLLAGLEASIAALEGLGGGGEPDWSALSDGTEGGDEPPKRSLVETGPDLAEWAMGRRLTAVLHGESMSIAVFDDSLVRVGHDLGSGVRVRDVGARWIEVVRGDERLRLGLERYVPSAPLPMDDELGLDSTGDGAAQTGSSPPFFPEFDTGALEQVLNQAMAPIAESTEDSK